MIYYCYECKREKAGCVLIDVVSKCIDCNIPNCVAEAEKYEKKLFIGGICRSCLKEKILAKTEKEREKTRQERVLKYLDLTIDLFGG